jgi:uncharacterized membrane protein
MKLGDYKLILIATAIIGSLIIASPAIAGVFRLPEGEQFSELYLLGPDRMAQDYPSNIAIGENYSVYVNVGNHLGSSAYYVLYLKLANATDQSPNSTFGTPSPLPPLYEYRFSIPDNTTWQNPLQFSTSKATIQGNNSQINTLTINDATIGAEKSATWNSNNTKFTYQLFFELWLYNETSGSVEFNNRYVGLQLNLTPDPLI